MENKKHAYGMMGLIAEPRVMGKNRSWVCCERGIEGKKRKCFNFCIYLDVSDWFVFVSFVASS